MLDEPIDRGQNLEQSQSGSRIPLARFSFEGVLIVVSILAAFGIDSWWSARQLAAEEQGLLLQLKSEFETNAVLLVERREQHESVVEATKSLLEVTGPDSTNKKIEDVERDLADMLHWWTYDPQMGVLTGMIQSGKLGVIRSDHLRGALASWPAKVQDLAEDEIYAVNFTHRDMVPYLTASTSMRLIGWEWDLGSGEFSGDIEGLLTDREFENLVIGKHNLTMGALEEYENLRAYIDDILKFIDEEIDTK